MALEEAKLAELANTFVSVAEGKNDSCIFRIGNDTEHCFTVDDQTKEACLNCAAAIEMFLSNIGRQQAEMCAGKAEELRNKVQNYGLTHLIDSLNAQDDKDD